MRIDEANALADLFAVSVDGLLGRSPAGSDLVWFTSTLTALARKSAGDVNNLIEAIASELAAFDLPDGSVEELIAATETALSALEEARRALAALGDMPVTGRTREAADYERQAHEQT